MSKNFISQMNDIPSDANLSRTQVELANRGALMGHHLQTEFVGQAASFSSRVAGKTANPSGRKKMDVKQRRALKIQVAKQQLTLTSLQKEIDEVKTRITSLENLHV